MTERVAEEISALDAFVAAVARPLDFLINAPLATLERTQIPAQALALKGRALLSGLPDGEPRACLETLVGELEQQQLADAQDRRSWAQRCRALLPRIQGGVATTVESEPTEPVAYTASSDDPHAAYDDLQRSVQFVRGVGPRRAEQFSKFGIETIEDLLYHLPFRYDDRRSVKQIRDVRPGDEVTIIGELAALDERRVGKAKRRILEGVLRDDTGLLGLTWYHQMTYFQHRYRVGQRIRVHGKIERLGGTAPRIVHPEVEAASEETGQGVLPVYNKPTTMTVAAMRKVIQQVAGEFASKVPSAIPPAVAARAGIADLPTALRHVHLPTPDANVGALNRFATAAHRSLVFDELFFFLQLGMLLRRRAMGQEAGTTQSAQGHLLERMRAALPFTLTNAQQRVVAEVLHDMQQPFAMQRLVQGDVGSGKTVVALFAALVAIENGRQTAFMAPTELLAEQHFNTLSTWCNAIGVRAVLLTGECRRSERTVILDRLAAGDIDLLVGTHALIQQGVRFKALGLGVIDEQHRFGVLQRAALRQLGESGVDPVVPDMLLMTATPIPRTLALTLYGDLNISVIDELPPGRQPCRTLVVNESERSRVYQLVRRELEAGRQAYIVYPLVEESEKEALRDATTMEKELRNVFATYRLGLVHGRMKAEDKEAVMRSFRAGDIHLLVSTTVIEVGVDVPNATIMVVEHAERFGLSQLHQLRGRVGRGSEQATCVLVAPYARGEDVHKRLQTMASTVDGFRIAEVDLEIRGPGEFLGTRQSGLPDFRVANLLRDTRLLALARETAEDWLNTDPDLSSDASSALRVVLKQRWAGRLGLAGIG